MRENPLAEHFQSVPNCPACGKLQNPSTICCNPKCGADVSKVKSSTAGLRFHDLRHHAITELAESQASDRTVMSIAGHVSQRMLAHYSHVRIEAKRKALDALAIGVKKVGYDTSSDTKPLEGVILSTQAIERNGGDDETRTRDLCRDRVQVTCFSATYKLAGTAKVAVKHTRPSEVWVRLWVGKFRAATWQPGLKFSMSVIAWLQQQPSCACQAAVESFSKGVHFPPMGMKRMFWRSRSVITEEAENETPVTVEVKRPHRRMKVILTLALSGALAGFVVSYAFPPKYTSQATVLVEGQKVPDNYVQPVITSDFAQRVQALSQKVLSPSLLRPVIHSLALVKPEDEGKLINDIQQNMQIEPVVTSMSTAVQNSPAAETKTPSTNNEPVPGFNVIYSDSDGVRAQKICNALTSLIVDENLKSRFEMVKSTTEFLSRRLAEAKNVLDDQDAKLAAFKKQYMGELPTDVDNNMSMLMSLNSQLDATTQTLNRAQEDKTYTESMLAQQIAAWKSSQSSTNPQTAAGFTDNSEKASAAEPLEIRQLRLQIHQYQGVIEQATLDQKKLQSAIGVYQSRTAMSPSIEEQYKFLTRDNDNNEVVYKELLAKKTDAELGARMEYDQMGEQMHIASTANLPDAPSFPNRPLLAAGGLGAGLLLGIGRLLWPAARKLFHQLALLFPIGTEI
jgi:uncharacterized protein involved in exopolysaccharide biosynthesis